MALECYRDDLQSISDPAPGPLPRFSDVNPVQWISKSERYFHYYAIYDDERFPYIVELFDDEPFWWFNSWHRSSEIVTWTTFTAAMLNRFHVGALDDHPTDSVTAASSISTSVDAQGSLFLQMEDLIPEIKSDSMYKQVHSTDDDFTNALMPFIDESPELQSDFTVFGPNESENEADNQQSGVVESSLNPNPPTPSIDDSDVDRSSCRDIRMFDASHAAPVQFNRILVLAGDSKKDDMVANNDGDVDSVVIHSFAWKPGLIENLIEVYPSNTHIISAISANHSHIGPSAILLAGHSSFFDVELPWLELGYVPTISFINQPYFHSNVLLFEPLHEVLLDSGNFLMDPVSTDFAQVMLNCATPAPTLFVLDIDPVPPDPYTTLTSDSIQVSLKPTRFVRGLSTTRCKKIRFTILIASPRSFHFDAELHGTYLVFDTGQIFVAQPYFHRDVKHFQPMGEAIMASNNSVLDLPPFIVGNILLVGVVTATSDYQQSLPFKDLVKEKNKITIHVTRNDCRHMSSIYELLIADIVHLAVSDQVPAAGLIVSGFFLVLTASSLTGASDPTTVTDEHPFLLSGIKVQNDSCVALLRILFRLEVYSWFAKRAHFHSRQVFMRPDYAVETLPSYRSRGYIQDLDSVPILDVDSVSCKDDNQVLGKITSLINDLQGRLPIKNHIGYPYVDGRNYVMACAPRCVGGTTKRKNEEHASGVLLPHKFGDVDMEDTLPWLALSEFNSSVVFASGGQDYQVGLQLLAAILQGCLNNVLILLEMAKEISYRNNTLIIISMLMEYCGDAIFKKSMTSDIKIYSYHIAIMEALPNVSHKHAFGDDPDGVVGCVVVSQTLPIKLGDHLVSFLTLFTCVHTKDTLAMASPIAFASSTNLQEFNNMFALVEVFAVEFLDPVITSFAALYGHTPPSITGYLFHSMGHVATEGNFSRLHQLFDFHLEDKMNLKGGSNVMNAIGPTQVDPTMQPNSVLVKGPRRRL